MLDGFSAFAALANRLSDGAACPVLEVAPFERLRLALDDTNATTLDRALLLRHALRYQDLQQNRRAAVTTNLISQDLASRVGLVVSTTQQRDRLQFTALPWQPTWLPHPVSHPADETSMKAQRRRFFPNTTVPGDPFLLAMARDGYRSPGQRAAIRAALAMPPGAQLVIDLPTGEGKSTVFGVIDAVGFASDPPGSARGTTLVIVPTVTLALDHERNSGGSEERPLAYIGGRTSRNDTIKAAIENGTQGLCFLAPEAACGPLRHTLGRAAANGVLRAVVVDEAHLVEGWGTGFRTEFQTFAGLCHAWRESCPPARQFRTVMLSATLTAASEQTLHDLFAPTAALNVVGAAKARPELEFWAAPPCDETERGRRVLEALYHLPRPVILYVTKIEDAEKWYARLRECGFGRIEKVHGKTSSEERERVLGGWSSGRVDLVVATSAFGLGVDYPHVRAVLHACIPETFDRFYQEAGRAGRDGCAAVSLVIPTTADRTIARSLAMKTVITAERGRTRWRAMFQHRDVLKHGHPKYGIRLDVAPGASREDIDMIGERSIDWNARTLALMARAGLIRLQGIPDLEIDPAQEEPPPPYQDIEIAEEQHLEDATWARKVEPKRAEISAASMRSFELMDRFLRSNECPGRLVEELYATSSRHVAVCCGGCGLCRADSTKRLADGVVGEQRPPWPVEGDISKELEALWGKSRRLLVEYPHLQPTSRVRQDFCDAIGRLDAWGLRLFMGIGAPPDWICKSLTTSVERRPWLFNADDGWFPARWPRGSRVVAFGEGTPIDPTQLSRSPSSDGALLLVPEGTLDATNPSRRLADVVPWATLSLQGFLGRVLR